MCAADVEGVAHELVGAVTCKAGEDRSSIQSITPRSTAEIWKPSRSTSALTADLENTGVDRQRSITIVVAGLYGARKEALDSVHRRFRRGDYAPFSRCN